MTSRPADSGGWFLLAGKEAEATDLKALGVAAKAVNEKVALRTHANIEAINAHADALDAQAASIRAPTTDVTAACVLKLRKAGLMLAAIADELRLSDPYVEGYSTVR